MAIAGDDAARRQPFLNLCKSEVGKITLVSFLAKNGKRPSGNWVVEVLFSFSGVIMESCSQNNSTRLFLPCLVIVLLSAATVARLTWVQWCNATASGNIACLAASGGCNVWFNFPLEAFWLDKCPFSKPHESRELVPRDLIEIWWLTHNRPHV